MKKSLMIVLVLFVGWAFFPKAFSANVEMKIGIVNVQEVLDSVEEGKKAKSSLEQFVLNRKKEVEEQHKNLKKMEDSFEKQKLILSSSAMEEKRKELEQKRMDFQKVLMTAQGDSQKKETELMAELLKKIRAVIEKIGREGNYTMIWEKTEAGIVFNKDQLDLTKQVIENYNKAYAKK